MQVAIKELIGNWDKGYALSKHVLSSTFLGHNQWGHPEFDTLRSEVGEALFQLKFRNDWTKVPLLATQIATSIVPLFDKVDLIIPMPASRARPRQPLQEIAKALGLDLKVPVFEEIVVKAGTEAGRQQLKDMKTKQDKEAALKDMFTINDSIANAGSWNALVLDDLFDTGASMEAVCSAIRTYPKVKRIYTATLTWK